ncbi:Oidioi.mRNA.OKI2018_I69.PAR.g11268.t1.cds [Oikopleura dioica]|uniref:Oidioi.mRNA.OKI2018_I69.PAR.g11268.t1.cds n=1 Tax=Oikopleura dioica TaxID=34765 RepID=A0ABN7S1P7_OIKDI|nr:Oidioi.mRNA.OKI2018_I69.PAR.g11268.t1.cds [Oikopleura dioica]
MLNSEKYKGQTSYSQNIVHKCEERLKNVLKEQTQIKCRIKSIQDEIEIIDKQLHNNAPKHILDRLIKGRTCLSTELSGEVAKEEKLALDHDVITLELEKARIELSKLEDLQKQNEPFELMQQAELDGIRDKRLNKEKYAAKKAIHMLHKNRRIQEADKDEQTHQIMTEIDGALTTHQRLEPFLKDTAHLVSQQKRNAKLAEQNFDTRRRDEIMKLKSAISASRDDITANEGKRGERRRKQIEKEQNRIKELMASGLTERAAQIQLFREKKRKEDEKISNLSRPKLLKPLLAKETQSNNSETAAVDVEAPIEQLDFGSLGDIGSDKDSSSQLNPLKAGGVQRVKSYTRWGVGKINMMNKLGGRPVTICQNDSDSSDEEEMDEEEEERQKALAAKRAEDEGRILIQPEFDGLWGAGTKASGDFDDFDFGDRDNETKVIEATDFVSKPDVIKFVDFKLDQKEGYTVVVQLINVSHNTSSIRYHSLSTTLSDFCSVEYEPCAPLSPGMATSFKLTFRPALIQVITGSIVFTTPLGSLTIPVECIPPRVQPKIDVGPEGIQFGKTVVGEVVERVVTLTNIGAMGGEFTCKLQFEGDEQRALLHQDDDNDPDSDNDPDHIGIIDEISMYPEHGGLLHAGSDAEITLTYSPKMPGSTTAELKIKVFKTKSNDSKDVGALFVEEFIVAVNASSIDLPVSVSNSEFDLGVMTYGFMFQEQFTVHNTANAARVVSFVVPKEFESMVEMYPKTGYVQGKSSMQAHVRFQPDANTVLELEEQESPFYDPENFIIEVPVLLKVAEQTRPLELYVYGIVTDMELKLSTHKIDFGYCTIHESVYHTVTITNPTLLIQDFGFPNIPDFISVRPDLGFGSITPEENLDVDISFMPSTAGEYKFEVVIETIRGFKGVIECQGIAVHPPLELSKQHIDFTTPLHGTHRESFYIYNNHTEIAEFHQSIPRIGKEDYFPVGPISFCFTYPESCGLIFSPAVGTIYPGERQFVTIMCNPTLMENDIIAMMRALHMEKTGDDGSGLGKTQSRNNLGRKRSMAQVGKIGRKQSRTEAAKDSFQANKGNPLYWVARDKLTRCYNSTNDFIPVPCFITPGSTSELTLSSDQCRYENCLWVHVRVRRLRPWIVVKNFNGKPAVDFGSAPIGETEKRTLLVENISDQTVEMKSSLLDPHGPFQLLNPLGELEPGETHFLLLTFSPIRDKPYHEVLQVHQTQEDCEHVATLDISMTGTGLRPTCSLIHNGITLPSDPTINMGIVQPNQEAKTTITIRNTSEFPIKFRISLDSDNDQFLANNRSGRVLFNCAPSFGILSMADEIKLNISFTPDHMGVFKDVLNLRLFGREYGKVHIHGMAILNSAFLDNVGYSSQRKGAGVGFSKADIGNDQKILEPVLVKLEAIPDQVITEYVGKIVIRAIPLSHKPKTTFEIFCVDKDKTFDDYPITITPGVTGEVESGNDLEIFFKFDGIIKLPFDKFMIRLKGDKLSEYNLVFATEDMDRSWDALPANSLFL